MDPIRWLHNRISNLLGRGSLRELDDSDGIQTLSADLGDDETRTELERLQQYGFTSVPLKGADLVVAFVNGSRDHGVVLAVDDRRYRLKALADGEVAIYTDQGDYIHLQRGGTIKVHASTKVVLDAPTVELAGNTDAAALASKVDARFAAIEAALLGWTVAPGDGGAALKAAAFAAFGSPLHTPPSTASTKVKAS